MVKTTVYLDGDVAQSLRQLALIEGRSQAELIRDALLEFTRRRKKPPIPGVGEFDSGEVGVAERAEEILDKASVGGKWRRQRSHGAHR